MMSGIYPVGAEVAAGGRVARWRPLVNWLLALPLLLWLCPVSAGAGVAVVVAWFSIVCTGRMPGRLGDYLMGVLRYGWRVGAFLFGLTDCYPGFRVVAGYVDPADQPAVFYSAQPLDRRRMTVLCRLILMVPALLFVVPVAIALGVLLFAAWWVVLVLGRWPEVLRRAVAGCFRYLLRFAGYTWLIVDVFPPVLPDLEPLTAEELPVVMRIQPDPREACGPPWPRLVGGEAYEPPGLLRWPIVVGVLCGLLPVSAVLATASSGPPAPAIGASPPAGRAITRQLGAEVLPAPADYTLDVEDAGYPYGGGYRYNGPISSRAFDKFYGVGTAAKLGFLGGYAAVYANDIDYPDLGSSELDIELFRFSSSEYAESYLTQLRQLAGSGASAFPAIPGAFVITDGTNCYGYEVMATKGPVAMQIRYNGPPQIGMCSAVAAWAEQQYAYL